MGTLFYIIPYSSCSVLMSIEKAFLFSSGEKEANQYLILLKIEFS